jgi:hypothetical protein
MRQFQGVCPRVAVTPRGPCATDGVVLGYPVVAARSVFSWDAYTCSNGSGIF